MTLSDWINDIRWKYFTNQKAGLIFKELMKEFQMVNKMTENKRYTYNDFGEIFKDKEIFAYSCSMSNAKAICKELNDKEEEIHRLKKMNK